MGTNNLYEEKAMLDAVHYFPSVSIILPFEPKMSIHRELEGTLERTLSKVEANLMANYTPKTARPIVNKLTSVINRLDFSSYKKSIVIFVSPLIEKVYYLDIPVEEKILIDEPFEIRDLIHWKNDPHGYLVLVLSATQSQIFVGNTNHFSKIVSNSIEKLAALENDLPDPGGVIADPAKRKEITLHKFLHKVDNGLEQILKSYDLPMFVMGTERIMGHFRKITHHGNRVIHYIHGNYDDYSNGSIRKAIEPYVADWKEIKKLDLLLHLDEAMSARKLAMGIRQVSQEARRKNGRLLVVENNYVYPVKNSSLNEDIHHNNEATDFPFFINDAVDEIIKKVLESGGNVEFVDEGVLKDFKRIALITYY